VYGPAYLELKEAFWFEFIGLSRFTIDFWIIRGDFNVIRYINDRKGNSSLRADSNRFNDIIWNFSLVDYPIGGRLFTLSNGRLSPNMAKIDRFLVSPSWDVKFPHAYMNS